MSDSSRERTARSAPRWPRCSVRSSHEGAGRGPGTGGRRRAAGAAALPAGPAGPGGAVRPPAAARSLRVGADRAGRGGHGGRARADREVRGMSNVFQRAVKRQARARVALCGPTGSGKTWNSLVWAAALGQKVALVDTERNSASLYAPHFEFDVVDFQPPYDPARLVELIKLAQREGYDVLVIDSLSHFWEGEGGTLD